MLDKKVYILDYEMTSPIAVGVENVVDSIKSNYSGDKEVERFSIEGCVFKKAAEVKEDLTPYYENESAGLKKAFLGDRKLELMAACYGKSADRLEHLISLMEPEKTGVILGVGAECQPQQLRGHVGL